MVGRLLLETGGDQHVLLFAHVLDVRAQAGVAHIVRHVEIDLRRQAHELGIKQSLARLFEVRLIISGDRDKVGQESLHRRRVLLEERRPRDQHNELLVERHAGLGGEQRLEIALSDGPHGEGIDRTAGSDTTGAHRVWDLRERHDRKGHVLISPPLLSPCRAHSSTALR